MSDEPRLAGTALVYTLTGALSAGVPLLLLPLLTRLLTPEEYGTVAMFALVVTVGGAFTGLSTNGAINVRYFERARVDLPRYITSCLVILLASTCIVMAVTAATLSTLASWTKIPAPWLFVAVLVAAAQFVVQIRLALWQSAGAAWSFAATRIGQAVTDASLSLLFVVAFGLTWQGRLEGILIAAMACSAFCLVSLRRGRWIGWPPSRAYIADALRFGAPLVPHTIGSLLVLMADRVLISNVLDVGSTGIYMVGMQMGMVIGLLTDAFNRAYAPWLMRSLGREDSARDRMIVRRTYLYFVFVIVIAFAYGALAPLLLSWLVGPQYQAASGIVAYVALGFAFGGMYYMVTNYVFFAGRTGGLALVTFGSGLFNVAITYYLLHRNGGGGRGAGFHALAGGDISRHLVAGAEVAADALASFRGGGMSATTLATVSLADVPAGGKRSGAARHPLPRHDYPALDNAARPVPAQHHVGCHVRHCTAGRERGARSEDGRLIGPGSRHRAQPPHHAHPCRRGADCRDRRWHRLARRSLLQPAERPLRARPPYPYAGDGRLVRLALAVPASQRPGAAGNTAASRGGARRCRTMRDCAPRGRGSGARAGQPARASLPGVGDRAAACGCTA